MAGCFAFTDEQIPLIAAEFTGYWAHRNRIIFLLCCFTGFRANEILSLELQDVYKNGIYAKEIRVKAENMKGKGRSRTVRINKLGQLLLKEWIDTIIETHDCILKTSPLWPTYSGSRLAYPGWWAAERKATQAALGPEWEPRRYSCHATRKTFYRVASEVLEKELKAGKRSGDIIYAMRDLLGHKDIRATAAYAPDQKTDSVVEAMGMNWNIETLIEGETA